MTPVGSLEQPATDNDTTALLCSTAGLYDASTTELLDEPREAAMPEAGDSCDENSPADARAADFRDCSPEYLALQRRFAEARNHFVILPAGNRSRLYQGLKRLLDIVGALFFIVLFSPILLVTYVVLAITSKC